MISSFDIAISDGKEIHFSVRSTLKNRGDGSPPEEANREAKQRTKKQHEKQTNTDRNPNIERNRGDVAMVFD